MGNSMSSLWGRRHFSQEAREYHLGTAPSLSRCRMVNGMPGRKPEYCLAQDRVRMYGSAQNISQNRVYQVEQGRWFFP